MKPNAANLRLNALLITSALTSITVAFSAPVFAQEDEKVLDTVEVIGLRAMQESAINAQRNSDTVESVLTRDEIGQFPDQNVAESVRRLTGVNILDDQGEGRYVSVRGLSPELNASSVNGVRLPSPEAETRQVALDVLPSELISSVNVKKTLTPDMDGDTIGASIEIETTKGFDREDPCVTATLEASYNDMNGKTSPKASVDFAYPVSENFGISGGLSYYNRKTSTDNMEMDGWSTSKSGVVYAEDVEYRDYDVERERIGASLSLDFRPTENTELYVRGIYSKFDDTEKRQRLVFALSEEPYAGTSDTASFQSDDGRIRVRRDLKDRFEGQTIQSYQVGGKTELDNWEMKYKLAYSKAEEHEHKTQDPTRFQKDFKKAGDLSVMFDYSNLETTTYDILVGSAAFNDASNYEFKLIEDVDGLSTDEEWSAKFDAERKTELANGDEFTLKFGAKARLRNKAFVLDFNAYDDYNGTYTLADVAGSQTYGLESLGVLPDLNLVRNFNSTNAANFILNPYDSVLEEATNFYDVDEDVLAAYAQGRYETGKWVVVGGLRVEQTDDTMRGNTVQDDGTSATPPVTQVEFSNDYVDALPSLNVKYDFSDEIVLRGGLYASVVRPGIGKIAPRFTINDSDEAEAGNPNLDPYRAWNFDASAEYYFAPGGVVQIGYFYKKVRDFIVDQTLSTSGTYGSINYVELTQPINGDSATVNGFEFNYQQSLDFLPGLLDGTLVGFNYTYTDTDADVGSRSIPLPSASKNTYNAMLGYDKAGLELRLTASYRDEYLDELGGSATTDRWVKDHLQIDASAKYRVNENFQVFADFVNMNDEPYLAFQKGPGRDRLLQFETYSYTAKIGVRYTR